MQVKKLENKTNVKETEEIITNKSRMKQTIEITE